VRGAKTACCSGNSQRTEEYLELWNEFNIGYFEFEVLLKHFKVSTGDSWNYGLEVLRKVPRLEMQNWES
jgi:hypothetical protein